MPTRLAPGVTGKTAVSQRPDGSWRASARLGQHRGPAVLVEGAGSSKAAAERALKSRVSSLVKEAATAPATDDPAAFRSVAETWFAGKKERGQWATQTELTYRSTLDGLLYPELAKRQVHTLTTPELNRLLAEIVRSTPGRAKTAKTVLTGVLRYAVARGHAQFNPAREIELELPRATADPRVLSSDELARLRSAAAAHDRGEFNRTGPRPEVPTRVLIEVGFALASRLGEVLALRWEDLELDGPEPLAHVRGTLVRAKASEHGAASIRQPHTKARRDRTVRLTTTAVEAIHSLPRRSEYVFASRAGTPITSSNAGERLRLVMAHAGLQGVSFHALRRTVATLVEQESGLAVAAKALGDRSAAVVNRHYVRTADLVPDFRASIERFAPASVEDPWNRSV